MECQYITDNSGVPVSVVIPISTWELIQKQLQQKSKKKSLHNLKERVELLATKYQDVKPFELISDPLEWQRDIRNEW